MFLTLDLYSFFSSHLPPLFSPALVVILCILDLPEAHGAEQALSFCFGYLGCSNEQPCGAKIKVLLARLGQLPLACLNKQFTSAWAQFCGTYVLSSWQGNLIQVSSNRELGFDPSYLPDSEFTLPGTSSCPQSRGTVGEDQPQSLLRVSFLFWWQRCLSHFCAPLFPPNLLSGVYSVPPGLVMVVIEWRNMWPTDFPHQMNQTFTFPSSQRILV